LPLESRDTPGPAWHDLLDGRALAPPGGYRIRNGREPGGESRIGVGGSAQPPQPQQMMQLVLVLWPPGAGHGSVVLSQELLMERGGQDAQDLDRVVRVILSRRLCRHLCILSQRADIVTEVGLSWS
jgi:hypothetical protein